MRTFKQVVVGMCLLLCVGISPVSADAGSVSVAGYYRIYDDEVYVEIEVRKTDESLTAVYRGEDINLVPVNDAGGRVYKATYRGREIQLSFIESGDTFDCELVDGESRRLLKRVENLYPRTEFTAAEYREDLAQLRHAIENYHPATYAFTGKDEFDSFFNKFEAAIGDDMSFTDFLIRVRRAVALIGCGHSRVLTPPRYWDCIDERIPPFTPRFLGEGAYVMQVAGDNKELKRGDRILSINGKTIPDILADMLPVTTSDGSKDANKLENLSGSFTLLYQLLYGDSETFSVTYIPYGEDAVREAVLAPVAYGEFVFRRSDLPNLEYKVLPEHNAALLTIRTFGYYNDRPTFYTFIDDAFSDIAEKGIRNVIFDFQGNSGGDPYCTVYLLSYILPEPVPYFAEEYEEEYAAFAQPIPLADKNRFDGNIYYLIDSECFSSTGHIAALLDYHHIGTFIGSETGGTYTCNDSTKMLQLKNTAIRVYMARMSYAVAVEGIPRMPGIKPKYPVTPTISDVLAGNNVALQKALEVIDAGR